MEIAEGALAMAAKNKINTKIAGLAKPQNTKHTHTHTKSPKNISPSHTLLHSRTRYGARHIAAGTVSCPQQLNRA